MKEIKESWEERNRKARKEIGYRDQKLRCCQFCRFAEAKDYYAVYVDYCNVRLAEKGEDISIDAFGICDLYEEYTNDET